MYRVFKLRSFEKLCNKILNSKDIKELNKIVEKLKENPFSGKPLNLEYLREQKLRDKRIYYLIYKNICLVILVGASNKKTQQKTIDKIKLRLKQYQKLAIKIHKEIE